MTEDNILSDIKLIQENYITLNKDLKQLQSMENKSDESFIILNGNIYRNIKFYFKTFQFISSTNNQNRQITI